nr:hypothetical protein [uncultured Neisseria sp.]
MSLVFIGYPLFYCLAVLPFQSEIWKAQRAIYCLWIVPSVPANQKGRLKSSDGLFIHHSNPII